CDQRAGTERLGEIVVGAEPERTNEIFLLAAHGQHHYRGRGLSSNRLAHLETAHARHVDIQYEQVRLLAGKAAECGGAIACFYDEITGLTQAEGDQVEQV